MKSSDHIRPVTLALLGGVSFAVLFSWSAMNTATGNETAFGRVALRLTTYPDLVKRAFGEARDRLSGAESYRHVSVPTTDADLTGFAPLSSATGETLDGFLASVDPRAADRGWRLFSGAFTLPEGVGNAAVLVDPDFTIRRIWRLNEDAVGADVAEDSRKIVHGLQMTGDGALLVTFDHGASLQRFGFCGGTDWVQRGGFHHSVTLMPDGQSLWTLRNMEDPETYHPLTEAFVQVDVATGEVMKTLEMGDVIEANPDMGLLLSGAQANEPIWSNARTIDLTWEHDPFHFNDIDPLPAEIAEAFPQFSAGDLLISARTLNALFVVDPESLQIKWHLAGATLRQHDPDWLPDGRISVLNNRTGMGPTKIMAFDPATNRGETLFDGAEADFYTRIRGKHQLTDHGDLAIVSPQQGRAFEVSNGAIVSEFYNLGPEGSGANLAMNEFLFFPETHLDLKDTTCNDS